MCALRQVALAGHPCFGRLVCPFMLFGRADLRRDMLALLASVGLCLTLPMLPPGHGRAALRQVVEVMVGLEDPDSVRYALEFLMALCYAPAENGPFLEELRDHLAVRLGALLVLPAPVALHSAALQTACRLAALGATWPLHSFRCSTFPPQEALARQPCLCAALVRMANCARSPDMAPLSLLAAKLIQTLAGHPQARHWLRPYQGAIAAAALEEGIPGAGMLAQALWGLS
ncbi:hypothetical protein PAPYR_2280 [Paratrimastix pyriformis]|uniref:Uncharacterized protein n=1 Tax=Paratrimastix pyriformis TaxID=342808 RepID=A0ABQ8UQ01_9EUKA|nr:hypothetical protein PAPYR_2280 [Paratrimastix pyriformis]